MKLQLDTENKTIKVEKDCRLGDLCDTLDKLLPGGAWHDYTLEANTVINNWTNPIIIKKQMPYFPSPIWVDVKPNTPPYYEVTCQSGDTTYGLQKGTYNLQC